MGFFYGVLLSHAEVPSDCVCQQMRSQQPASVASTSRKQCHADYVQFKTTAVTNHGVPDELLERQFRESAAFFAQPLQEKLRLQVGKCSSAACCTTCNCKV